MSERKLFSLRESERVFPYPYQEDCLKSIQNSRARGKNRALVVMATGLGKTVLAAMDVNSVCISGDKVLYLAHQKDILTQAKKTFEEVLGDKMRMGYLHGTRKDLYSDVLFATFQTLQNWTSEFNADYFRYVVVDESHHSKAETYTPVIKHFTPSFMLGITATPDREDLRDIREVFGTEVFNLPLEKALALGYLTPVDYRVMSDDIR